MTETEYDASVALDIVANGKLTDEETKDLKANKLQPVFGRIDEDISDILDYSFAMVNNGKSMGFVVKEIIEMGMDFCPEDKAHSVAKVLAEHIQQRNGGASKKEATAAEEASTGATTDGSKRVVSLKSKTGGNALALSGALGSSKKNLKGNALTMAGALGASRTGEKQQKQNNRRDNSNSSNNRRDRDKDNRCIGGRRDRDDRGGARGSRDDRGGREGRGSGGRGNRHDNNRRDGRDNRGRGDRNKNSRQSEAFDRLSNNNRNSRNVDDQNEWGTQRGGGRGGSRSPGRGGGRFSGNRRDRDDMEHEEDFMAAPQGEGGRGEGRGGKDRGRGDSPNKRMRMENGEGAGGGEYNSHQQYDYNKGYDDSYDYNGGYAEGFGGYCAPPSHHCRGGFRGGRGRGMGRGRGRGRGRFGGRGAPPADSGGDPNAAGTATTEGNGEGGGGNEKQPGGGKNAGAAGGRDVNVEAVGYHPSPMVNASYGGRFGYSAYRGRGRGFRGRGRSFRGRGFHAGRAHVAGLIASKTWTRQKGGDNDAVAAPTPAGDGGGSAVPES